MKNGRSWNTKLTGLTAVLWVNAALLAVVCYAMVARSPATDGSSLPGLLPVASAQATNSPPIAGGAGVFIMPAQMGRDVWGTYLLDVDAQTIAAYVYSPNQRQLQLVAARTYRYDRRLENFNTAAPSPSEVRELVDRQARVRAGVPEPAPSTQPNQ